MMNEDQAIVSNEVYLESMRNTFHDKCWFMSIIPEDVTHILDFGCADGSFIKFLKASWPKYQYIGLESNEDFRSQCQKDGIEVASSIIEASKILGEHARHTLVVMNSVLHEIYSYEGTAEGEEVWGKLMRNGFRYIALRDMYAKGCGCFSSKTELEIQDILSKDKCTSDNSGGYIHINEKFEDFERQWGPVLNGYDFTHFLLKYFYNKNWTRENMENYLPYHYRELHEAIREAGYDVTFESFYSLPWLKQKWMRDWDCDTHPALGQFIRTILTHMKLFLVAPDGMF